MLIARHLLVLALLTFAMPPASALADDGKSAKEVAGTCVDIRRGIRECYIPGDNKLLVKVPYVPGSGVLLHIPETWDVAQSNFPDLIVVQKPKHNKRVLTITVMPGTIPPSARVHIVSAQFQLSLRFERVKLVKDVASQIHLVPVDQRGVNQQIERRIEAERAKLRSDYDAKEAKLRASLPKMARARIVRSLRDARASLRAARGRTKDRADFIVVEALDRLRIGSVTYLEFSVQNVDSPALEFRVPTIYLQRGSSSSRVRTAIVDCKRYRLPSMATTRCSADLGLSRRLKKNERIAIDVRERAGDKHVRLKGVDVR